MWMILPLLSMGAPGVSRFNLLDYLEMRDALALGRGERFLARVLLRGPRRREKAHAAHALDGLQHVHGAAHRPPAVARGLHEAEAAAHLVAVEGRRVAHQAPGVHVEAQEREPILHPGERHEAAVPRKVAARDQRAAQAPEAPRIEAHDRQAAL